MTVFLQLNNSTVQTGWYRISTPRSGSTSTPRSRGCRRCQTKRPDTAWPQSAERSSTRPNPKINEILKQNDIRKWNIWFTLWPHTKQMPSKYLLHSKFRPYWSDFIEFLEELKFSSSKFQMWNEGTVIFPLGSMVAYVPGPVSPQTNSFADRPVWLIRKF